MQCHLGLCLAVRCYLTLESFTRGLASEDADQHAQRFVTVIAQRALTCCASKPSAPLASRTDHNAATPSASLMFAPELNTSAIALAGITQLPDGGRSRRRGQARSPSGTERSGVA
jgi:hypothetical protein